MSIPSSEALSLREIRQLTNAPRRYRCCKHCEDPCPAIGHTKICFDCNDTGGRKGRGTLRIESKTAHYHPAVVRTWPKDALYITSRDLDAADAQDNRLTAGRA